MMDLKKKRTGNWAYEAKPYSSNILKEYQEPALRAAWEMLLRKNLTSDDSLDILDVGTGPGFFAILLSKMGYRVTAVDCVPEMLEEAITNAYEQEASANFALADCESLPFPDKSFDCILSRNVTWTLLDAKSTYQSWLRLLRPNGKILIFDANWNYHYYNDERMEQYRQDCAEYERMFQKPASDFTSEQEAYRRNLPMCRVPRPAWDLQIFSELNVKRIQCDFDITDMVWDEARRIKYRSSPMFMLAVEK